MHIGLEKLNLNTEPQYDLLHIQVELAMANESLNESFRQCDALTRLADNVNDIFSVARRYGEKCEPVLQDLFGMQLLEYSNEGFWEGVKKFFAAIWNAIKKFFGWIWNGIKRLFGKGKIPGSEHANELAQAVPELAPLIDTSVTSGAHAGLDTLVQGLAILSKSSGAHFQKGNAVNGCAVDKLKVVIDGLVSVFDKTVENVKATANQYVGSISDTTGNSEQDKAAAAASNAAISGIETAKKKLVDDYTAACSTIKDAKIVQAIATGNTEGLQEYITENYIVKITDPQELINNINATKELTNLTQKYTNDISTGLSSVEKELVEKLATKDGQVDGAKKGAINALVMTGFQQLKRILGIFQGMYNFFLQTENTLAGDTQTILGWFETDTAKQTEAKEKSKQTRADNKAKKEAAAAAAATPNVDASKASAAGKKGARTRKQNAATKSEK